MPMPIMVSLNLIILTDWYGLFKQRITAEGQEEVAEDWLEKFSPWEIVRHDIVYSVRLFGHVEINPDRSGSDEGQFLSNVEFIWPMMMIGSSALQAGASILKEFIFIYGEKRLKGKIKT
ncbi:alpha-glucan phosphorylase family protein [Carex littledalei]|uniref:Alpha-1,4 glucan phosphorylase n=1 Tax=Carex littledalei TaxID=544730 RepID=A0A833QR61_9POAL|nr:alpha-glucan phosphorylase family protein [Carex littledalei]